jgi:hypothetical protein
MEDEPATPKPMTIGSAFKRPIKRSWLIWLAVSVAWSAYCLAGYVASQSASTQLTLQPGASSKVRVLRLADDDLRMELVFRGDHGARRSELGEWVLSSNEMNSGFLRFATPGAAVRVAASTSDGVPVTYEAMPTSSYRANETRRRLTSDLSVEHGVWRWPPRYKDLVLHRGYNDLKVEVVSVEPALAGESVGLVVYPELGFKVTRANGASALWLWFLWPIIVAAQLVWGIVLMVRSRKRVRP